MLLSKQLGWGHSGVSTQGSRNFQGSLRLQLAGCANPS
jgi:hypothetical protein